MTAYRLRATSPVLRVFPRFDVAEQDALVAVDRRGVARLDGRITFGQLVADLVQTLPGVDDEEPRYAPSPIARLALAEAIASLDADAHYAPLVHDRAFLRRVASFIRSCKDGLVTPTELAGSLGDEDAARLRELGTVYARYQGLLRRARLYDDGDRIALAIERIRSNDPLPPSLRNAQRVEFTGFLEPTPGRIALVEALADRLARDAGQAVVHVQLPYDHSLRMLTGCVEAVLKRFEQRPNSSLDVGFFEEEPSRPAQIVESAWTGVPPDTSAYEAVRVVRAANEREEQLDVARQIRSLLRAGVGIDEIVVVQRTMESPPAELTRAFTAMGVPWHFRRGQSLSSTPLFRFVVSIFRADQRGISRSWLEEVLNTSYCKIEGLNIAERQVAIELLRASGYISDSVDRATMGVRSCLDRIVDSVATTDRIGALRQHRRLYDAVLAASDEGATNDTPVLDRLRTVRARIIDITEQAVALNSSVRLADWATSAATLLQSLGIAQQAALVPDIKRLSEADAPARERLARALARDQQTLRHILALLDDMSSYAAVWPLESSAERPRDYCDWFEEMAEGLHLNPKGARGGAIRLMPITEVAFAKYRYVFLMGAVDGQLPRRFRPDLLVTDRQRARMNGARRKRGDLPAFLLHEPLDDEPDAAMRQDWEPLYFYLTARAATRQLSVSYARSDYRGRPLLASAYVDQLRASGVVPEHDVELEPIPTLDRCVSPEDLATRALFELGRSEQLLGNESANPAQPASGWAEIADQATAHCTGASVRLRAQAELARIIHQASADPWSLPETLTPFGTYLGFLSPGIASRIANHDRLRFDSDNPVSPTRLDRLGGNPGQGLFVDVIRIRDFQAPQLTPSPARIGTLIHTILERAFRSFNGNDLIPLPRTRDPLFKQARDILMSIADQAFAQLERTEHVGIPLVWTQHKKDIVGHLESFLVVESSRHQQQSIARIAVEIPFGGRPGHADAIPKVALKSESGTYYLSGYIDRIDFFEDGGAYVIDYKTGGTSASLRRQLSAAALGQTSHQLLAYLAAAEQHAEVTGTAKALYVALNGDPNPYVDRHQIKRFRQGTPAIDNRRYAAMYVGNEFPGLTPEMRLTDFLAQRVALYRDAIVAGRFPTVEQPAFGPFVPISRQRNQKGSS